MVLEESPACGRAGLGGVRKHSPWSMPKNRKNRKMVLASPECHEHLSEEDLDEAEDEADDAEMTDGAADLLADMGKLNVQCRAGGRREEVQRQGSEAAVMFLAPDAASGRRRLRTCRTNASGSFSQRLNSCPLNYEGSVQQQLDQQQQQDGDEGEYPDENALPPPLPLLPLLDRPKGSLLVPKHTASQSPSRSAADHANGSRRVALLPKNHSSAGSPGSPINNGSHHATGVQVPQKQGDRDSSSHSVHGSTRLCSSPSSQPLTKAASKTASLRRMALHNGAGQMPESSGSLTDSAETLCGYAPSAPAPAAASSSFPGAPPPSNHHLASHASCPEQGHTAGSALSDAAHPPAPPASTSFSEPSAVASFGIAAFGVHASVRSCFAGGPGNASSAAPAGGNGSVPGAPLTGACSTSGFAAAPPQPWSSLAGTWGSHLSLVSSGGGAVPASAPCSFVVPTNPPAANSIPVSSTVPQGYRKTLADSAEELEMRRLARSSTGRDDNKVQQRASATSPRPAAGTANATTLQGTAAFDIFKQVSSISCDPLAIERQQRFVGCNSTDSHDHCNGGRGGAAAPGARHGSNVAQLTHEPENCSVGSKMMMMYVDAETTPLCHGGEHARGEDGEEEQEDDEFWLRTSQAGPDPDDPSSAGKFSAALLRRLQVAAEREELGHHLAHGWLQGGGGSGPASYPGSGGGRSAMRSSGSMEPSPMPRISSRLRRLRNTPAPHGAPQVSTPSSLGTRSRSAGVTPRPGSTGRRLRRRSQMQSGGAGDELGYACRLGDDGECEEEAAAGCIGLGTDPDMQAHMETAGGHGSGGGDGIDELLGFAGGCPEAPRGPAGAADGHGHHDGQGGTSLSFTFGCTEAGSWMDSGAAVGLWGSLPGGAAVMPPLGQGAKAARGGAGAAAGRGGSGAGAGVSSRRPMQHGGERDEFLDGLMDYDDDGVEYQTPPHTPLRGPNSGHDPTTKPAHLLAAAAAAPARSGSAAMLGPDTDRQQPHLMRTTTSPTGCSTSPRSTCPRPGRSGMPGAAWEDDPMAMAGRRGLGPLSAAADLLGWGSGCDGWEGGAGGQRSVRCGRGGDGQEAYDPEDAGRLMVAVEALTSTKEFNTQIGVAADLGDRGTGERLWREMSCRGVAPNVATLNGLLRCMSRSGVADPDEAQLLVRDVCEAGAFSPNGTSRRLMDEICFRFEQLHGF